MARYRDTSTVFYWAEGLKFDLLQGLGGGGEREEERKEEQRRGKGRGAEGDAEQK